MVKIGLFLAVSLVFFYCAPIAEEGSFQAPNISVSSSTVAKGKSSSDGGGEGGDTDSGDTDSGDTDSGDTDSGDTDSGSTDGGTTDSGGTDSGSTDGGTTDSGGTTTGETNTEHGPEFINKRFPEPGPPPPFSRWR